MMDKKLGDMYRYIIQYKKEHDGVAPSFQEIKDALGVSSKSVVDSRLNKLECLGLIRRPPYKAAGIEVVGGRWTLDGRGAGEADVYRAFQIVSGCEIEAAGFDLIANVKETLMVQAARLIVRYDSCTVKYTFTATPEDNQYYDDPGDPLAPLPPDIRVTLKIQITDGTPESDG